MKLATLHSGELSAATSLQLTDQVADAVGELDRLISKQKPS
jgi:hypothetical protein